MKIKCPHCHTIVDPDLLFSERIPARDQWRACTYHLVSCSLCHGISLSCDLRIIPKQWIKSHEPERILWPQPKDLPLQDFPKLVASYMNDAQGCYNAGVYSASAVMCGKVIEAICLDKIGQPKNLREGLQRLKSTKIIDELLYSWGELLRRERNIGAHASEQETTKQDADDVLEFAYAICHYIYVLSKKQSKYLSRKRSKTTRSATS